MFEILSTCCSYGFMDRRECLILSLFYIGALSQQDVESYIVKFDFVPLNSPIMLLKDPSSLTVMLCSQKIFSWATKVEAVELESNVWIERSSVSIAVKMDLRIEDLLAAPSQSNASTEELPNHFMAYSKHRRKILSLPQHKPHS